MLLAHPALHRSRVNRRLADAVRGLPGITLHDLYAAYPDLDVDVEREKTLLTGHDALVWQHPFYWYSTPALLKEWQDLVLEFGWAYGPGGHALRGKPFLSVVTTGGREVAYQHGGFNRFTVRELLAPIEQTAYLCGLAYLPPLVVHGALRLDEDEIAAQAEFYRQVLIALRDGRIDPASVADRPSLDAGTFALARG